MMGPRRWLTLFGRDASNPASAQRARVSLDTRTAPAGTDLRWRPGVLSHPFSPAEMTDPHSGQRLGDDAALWHDGSGGEMHLRQTPVRDGAAEYGLRFELLDFGASYLSLSVDLPPDALCDLSQAHVLRLEIALRLDGPLRVYARLNVRHGPNTDEILRDLPPPVLQPDGRFGDGRQVVEFDMAATDINERRLEKIWLDLIFEHPASTVIEISEMILSRHLRANF